jgi:hypothetical protein
VKGKCFRELPPGQTTGVLIGLIAAISI